MAVIGPSACVAVLQREGWFVVAVFFRRRMLSTAGFDTIVFDRLGVTHIYS